MNYISVRTRDRASLRVFLHKSLRQAIAWPQFHGSQPGPRVRRSQTVILQVSITILVYQKAAFSAGRLGNQDSGARKSSGVILYKFHVLQGNAGAVGDSHPVS